MDDYSDIIDLPHPEPKGYHRMSMQARAAQFAPFAALTGHSEAIVETARMTEDEIFLYEDNLTLLNQTMKELVTRLDTHPEISITYFEPDARKSGGYYKNITGTVLQLDNYTHSLILKGGLQIELKHIIDISINDRLE